MAPGGSKRVAKLRMWPKLRTAVAVALVQAADHLDEALLGSLYLPLSRTLGVTPTGLGALSMARSLVKVRLGALPGTRRGWHSACRLVHWQVAQEGGACRALAALVPPRACVLADPARGAARAVFVLASCRRDGRPLEPDARHRLRHTLLGRLHAALRLCPALRRGSLPARAPARWQHCPLDPAQSCA